MIKYIAFADSPYALTLINDQTQQLPLEDVYIEVDSSGGGVEIILPLTTDFPVQNLRIFVQDKTGDAATNPIVISTQGSDLINGGASFTINTAYGFARIQIGAEGLYTVTAANTPGSGGWATVAANGNNSARVTFPVTIGKQIIQLFTDGILRNADASLGPVDYTHNTVTGGVDFAGTVYPDQIIFIVYAL